MINSLSRKMKTKARMGLRPAPNRNFLSSADSEIVNGLDGIVSGSSGTNLICNTIYFSVGNSGPLAGKQTFSRLLRLLSPRMLSKFQRAYMRAGTAFESSLEQHQLIFVLAPDSYPSGEPIFSPN